MSEIFDTATGEVFDATPSNVPTLDIETSAQLGEIAAAIAKAQTEIGTAAKDSKNPHFSSRYASLAAVAGACQEALAKNGVATIQTPFNLPSGDVGVATMFAHGSGQWMKGRLYVKPVKYDAQGLGSVITYLRRYCLAAMAGVAPADDDGEAAVGRPTDQRQAAQPKAQSATNGSGAPIAQGPDIKAAQEAYNRLKKALGDALDTAEVAELIAGPDGKTVKDYAEANKTNNWTRIEEAAKAAHARIAAFKPSDAEPRP